MIDLLCLLLPYALRAVDERLPLRKRWHLFPAALLADIVDLVLARTSFAWMVGRGPIQGERTVSDMLEHLCFVEDHPDQQLFIQISLKINRVAGYPHIKAVA